jgi:protein lysine acetyltransferase
VTLSGLALFADVPQAELAGLEAQLTPVSAEPGDVLLREGERGDTFVLVLEGTATVTRAGIEVGRVGRGSIVGELALLRGAPRLATVTCTSALRGLAGDGDAFAALTEAPGVRERFGRTAARRLIECTRTVPTVLADGTPVETRPVLPEDRARLRTTRRWCWSSLAATPLRASLGGRTADEPTHRCPRRDSH